VSQPKQPTTQVPGLYRHRLGEFTITAINDGYLQAAFEYVTHIDPAEGSKRLAAGFRADPPRITISAFAVHTPKGIVLIDSGCGSLIGETGGRVATNLATAGIDPADVVTILLTHMHLDHVGGLTDGTGLANYPNAELVLHKDEAAFWLSADRMAAAPEAMKSAFITAQAATSPYKDRMRTLSSGEAVPGISIVPEPGHTPGHSGWMLTSGSDTLLVWGDIVHLPGLQFADPRIGLVFDSDADQAFQTRKRIFDMAATDRILVAGMHLDFPPIGHVQRMGQTYAFAPLVWQSVL
jgi:glyoxylase-like metal-dependent hydrolase (beta-lactamase superfamily II)